MHPFIREIDLYAIDIGNLVRGETLLHFRQDRVHVNLRSQLNLLLRDEIRRIRGTQLGGFHLLLCQMRQEEGDAHQCVAAIMASGINHAAIALATNHGTGLLHLSDHVHLAHGSGVVFASMRTGHIAQGAAGAQVAYRIARRMTQHVIAHGYQRIFLAEHLPVLANNSQAVHIRIHHEAHIRFRLRHQGGNLRQVLGKRLGVMGEITMRRAMQLEYLLHAQGVQQIRQHDTSHGVHAIDRHPEISGTNRLHIHERKRQHPLDMLLLITRILDNLAQMLHIGEREILGSGDAQHLGSLSGIEELTPLVQQLQGIPLLRIMAGGQYNATASALHRHGHLGRRCRGKADVHHIKTHPHQGAHDDVPHHRPGDAGIAPHDNLVGIDFRMLTNKGSVGRHEFHDR